MMAMKLDSPFFDRIRVKPARNRRAAGAPRCEWPGCDRPGTHRAPKGRNREQQYWHFCLEHVRAYNQSYNFFDGMSDDAVERYQKDAVTGHRPTWKLGQQAGTRFKRVNVNHIFAESAADPFAFRHEFGTAGASRDTRRAEPRMVRNAELKALHALGLEAGADRQQIKSRFKALVKQHHPDANHGDRGSEDKLREIIEAYNFLKSTGSC